MRNEVNHKLQEAKNFFGRKGISYVTNSATQEERSYFQGTLYNKEGSVKKSLLYELYNSVYAKKA